MADSEVTDNKSPASDKKEKKKARKEERALLKQKKKERREKKRKHRKENPQEPRTPPPKEKKGDKYKRQKALREEKKRKREEEAAALGIELPGPKRKKKNKKHKRDADDAKQNSGLDGVTGKSKQDKVTTKTAQGTASESSQSQPLQHVSTSSKSTQSAATDHDSSKKEANQATDAKKQHDHVDKNSGSKTGRSATQSTASSEDSADQTDDDTRASNKLIADNRPSTAATDKPSQRQRSTTPSTESLSDASDDEVQLDQTSSAGQLTESLPGLGKSLTDSEGEAPITSNEENAAGNGTEAMESFQDTRSDITPESTTGKANGALNPRIEASTADDKGDIKNATFKIVEDVGEGTPAIVIAPGLDTKKDLKFNSYLKPRDKAVNPADKSPWKQELLLHNESHPTLDYVAREEASGGADSYLKHYVGIFDPNTGECQLIPARKLTLRSHLKSARTEDEEELEEEPQEPLTSLEKRTALQQAFGTKKSQKVVKSLQENKIDTPLAVTKDADGKVVLDASAAAVIDAMDDTAMPDKKTTQAESDAAKPIPKPNLEAERPIDVYTLDELIGKETLKQISISQWETSVKDNKNVQTISRFVSKRLENVVKSKDTNKAKTLKFLLALLQWKQTLSRDKKGNLRLPGRNEEKKDSLKDIEPLVVERIKKKFVPDGKFDGWYTDYLMTNICCLALIVDDFETDVCELREDLALELNQIVKYYRELGCHVGPLPEAHRERQKLTKVTAAAHHRLAKLKMPLQFPKGRRPPGGR